MLYPLIHQTLRVWNKPEKLVPAEWATLFIVRQYDTNGEEIILRDVVQALVKTEIERLAAVDEEGTRILTDKFWRGETGRHIAMTLDISPDHVNRLQRRAIMRLATELAEAENGLREAAMQAAESHLQPKTYTELFGVASKQLRLVDALVAPNAPWLFAITGIGGIGKSSLMDAVTRQVIGRFCFDHIFWIRLESFGMKGRVEDPKGAWLQVCTQLAQQFPDLPVNLSPSEKITHLRHMLKRQPSLVVIDNIEGEQEVVELCNQLRGWANPSKFVLTSRVRPIGVHGVLVEAMDELNEADSLALLRAEAHLNGVTELATAVSNQLQPIYHLVGGNPLALKLVVGLAAVMPLQTILTALSQNYLGPTEAMYRHIYWQAWHSLSEEGRILLEAMPLIAEYGATPEQMRAMSELDKTTFWDAVRELVTRSLLEVRGTTWKPRYGVHRLTETFLQAEIIGWEQDDK